MLKNTETKPLLETIRAVNAGTYRLPAELAAKLAQRRTAPQLSAREREVLELIVRGRSNKEIGSALGVAENTVKNHVRNILEKLQLRSRMEAAMYAVREKLVDAS